MGVRSPSPGFRIPLPSPPRPWLGSRLLLRVGNHSQLPTSGQLFTAQTAMDATTLECGIVSPHGQMKTLMFRQVKGGSGILSSVLPSRSHMGKVCSSGPVSCSDSSEAPRKEWSVTAPSCHPLPFLVIYQFWGTCPWCPLLAQQKARGRDHLRSVGAWVVKKDCERPCTGGQYPPAALGDVAEAFPCEMPGFELQH